MHQATGLSVSDAAIEYFERLLEDQDEADLALRIRVVEPGTPQADCKIEFAEPDELGADDVNVRIGSRRLFLEAGSLSWLEGAKIDFAANRFGGRLTVEAPAICGQEPGPDAALEVRVKHVIEREINPDLARHRGFVQLESISDTQRVKLRFGGGCHGCGQVDATLRGGVEKMLRARFPEIAGVDDVTDHASGTNPYY